MMPCKFASPTFAVTAAVLGGIALASSTCSGAVLTLDTFDDKPFSLESDQSSPRIWHGTRGSMWGGQRSTTILVDRRPTTIRAELAAGSSLLVFDTGDGPPGGLHRQGSLWLRYSSSSNALNLLGATGFELNFQTLTGAGEVHIGLNSNGFGSSSTTVPVTAPGIIFIPIESTDLEAGTLERVGSLQLVISGTTPDFAMSLDSFRTIPEPSTPVLLAISSLVLLRRRV